MWFHLKHFFHLKFVIIFVILWSTIIFESLGLLSPNVGLPIRIVAPPKTWLDKLLLKISNTVTPDLALGCILAVGLAISVYFNVRNYFEDRRITEKRVQPLPKDNS
jgi:hypothetical protein